MKKLMVFGISFVYLLFVFISLELSSGVRINEVMADPDRCPDSDCEYIEIYSDVPINLTNWIINTTNQAVNFNFYLEDYLIITRDKNIFIGNFSVNENNVIELGIGLVNSGESVFLFNNSNLVSNFTYSSSTAGKSWQYCEDGWIEEEATPNLENNCEQQSCTPDCDNKECGDDGCGGSCGNCNNDEICENGECIEQDSDVDEDDEISIDLDWDEDDIINGKEFEIDISLENLKSEDYDVKIWIEDNDDIMSETYHKQENKWLSSTYYIIELVSGPDNDKEIKLRINEDYENFKGDAEINARIRRADTEDIKDFKNKDIEILEKEEEDEKEDNSLDQYDEDKTTSQQHIEQTPDKENGNGIIKLGNKNSLDKIDKGKVLYESSSEKMKKYSIYFLSALLIVIIIVLIKKI